MKATLYLPGQTPTTVILSENTPEAAARLLGVPAAVVFPVEEETGIPADRVSIYGNGEPYDGTNFNPQANDGAEAALGCWCDFHGRILIVLN